MDILKTAASLFSGLKIPPKTDVEVYLGRGESRVVSWAEGHPEDTQHSVSNGVSVRVISEGRQGMASSNDVSDGSVSFLMDKALSACKFIPEDRHRYMVGPAKNGKHPMPVDKEIFGNDIGYWHGRLRTLEAEALRADERLKKIVRIAVGESLSETAIVNSRGVKIYDRNALYDFASELMAESGGEVQVGSGYMRRARFDDFNMEKIITEARKKAVGFLGARPVSSKKMNVIFDPWVGSDFLNFLTTAVCGDSVQTGKSLFAGKLGKKVSSDIVDIVDDGTLGGGVASAPYDGEGVPTRKVDVIKEGVLKSYLHDSYTASRAGTDSTGNASRSFTSPPSPGSSNFYMSPGGVTEEALIRSVDYGILLREVIGMHTANVVSGDFSVGAVGMLIEKGRITRSVRGVTIAGNILELLNGIDMIADDLVWYGSCASPSFRVRSLSVSGS